MIKISVPNDDHVALRAMAKALEEIAVARGAPVLNGPFTTEIKIDMSDESVKERLQRATQDLMQAAPAMLHENDVDGSIEVHGKRKDGATHIITSQEKVGDPVDLGDGNFSQGYRIEMEELPTADSTGTPWDERIHSASKALNGDGTWRLRRKPKDMDEEEWLAYVETVKAELMWKGVDPQTLEELTSPEMDNSGEPTLTPEGDDFHVDAGVVTEQQVASFPPPPPVPSVDIGIYQGAANGIGANPTAMTFPQVMAFLTERHGRITSAQVDQIIADMGLEKITDLNTQPEHTGPFIARVKALLGE